MDPKTSTEIQEHISAFHELMIVILRRRAFFRLLEESLKQKASKSDVENNAFVSYYIMDYVRGQLVDMRKFFETDDRSYKISTLVSFIGIQDLEAGYQKLYAEWRDKFKVQVNKLVTHIDKDSKDLLRQVKKQAIDEFIDETNAFLNNLMESLQNKGTLIFDDSLRDPNRDFLNVEQEAEFREFQKWLRENDIYKGTIVENSLVDKNILKKIRIEKNYKSGDWILDDILVEEIQIPQLSRSLADGPWYIHLWKSGKDDVKVIFKNKIFNIKFSDKSTWAAAVAYGKSIGIPDEQLDFPID